VVSLDTNGDGVFDAGDQVFTFGQAGDKLIVGDWNGDGKSKIGVVRNDGHGGATVILDSNGKGVSDPNITVFSFGYYSDTFVVGDWNGDGRSKAGVVRPTASGVAQFSLDTNGNHTFDAGDQVFSFGLNTDTFLTGKWKQPAPSAGAPTPTPAPTHSSTPTPAQQTQPQVTPQQIQQLWQNLSTQRQLQVWQQLSPQQDVQLYQILTPAQQSQLWQALSATQRQQLVQQEWQNLSTQVQLQVWQRMTLQQQVELLGLLTPSQRNQLLAQLTNQQQTQVLSYGVPNQQQTLAGTSAFGSDWLTTSALARGGLAGTIVSSSLQKLQGVPLPTNLSDLWNSPANQGPLHQLLGA
jgi:hypothetical protein